MANQSTYSAGVSRRQRAQHRPPAADRGDGAPLQRPAGAVEPLPGGGIEARRLLVEDPPGRRRQLPKRRVQPCQRHLEALGRLQQARHRRADRRLEAVARIAVGRAGVHLLANEREEGFSRAGRHAGAQPGAPAGAGKDAGGGDDFVKGSGGGAVVGDEIGEPLAQAPPARPPAVLGAAQPAAQLRGLEPGQRQRKGGVGGVEQVVALVEDIAQRDAAVVAAPRRLGHHQGVVGDDDVGAPRPADGAFDEALPIVPAGAVDAFAAGVGEVEGELRAEQVGEPAGEVAAVHVAVAGHRRPAGDQPERHPFRGRNGGARGDGVFQVQQAEDVLPALADDDVAGLLGEVGIGAVELAVDLPLQGAGVGAEPDRRPVLPRPDARGGDVADRLADAGAGLGEHHLGLPRPFARSEGMGDGGHVGELLRPRLRRRAQKLDQPGAGLDRLHRPAVRGRVGRRLVPFAQAPPDLEPGDRVAAARATTSPRPRAPRDPTASAPRPWPGRPARHRRRARRPARPTARPRRRSGSPPRPPGSMAGSTAGRRQGRGASARRTGPGGRRRRARAGPGRRSGRGPACGRRRGRGRPAAPRPGRRGGPPRPDRGGRPRRRRTATRLA